MQTQTAQTQVEFRYTALVDGDLSRMIPGNVMFSIESELLDCEDAEQVLDAMIEDHCGGNLVAYVYEFVT